MSHTRRFAVALAALLTAPTAALAAQVTSPLIAFGTANHYFYYELKIDGYSPSGTPTAQPLPPGLTLDTTAVSPNITGSPTQAGVYSVTLSGTSLFGGTATAVLSITIIDAPAVTLTASPTSILPGQSSTLTWSSTGATVCEGTGFSTGGAPSGSLVVSPTVPSAYSILCQGTGSSTPGNTFVDVAPAATLTVNQPTTFNAASFFPGFLDFTGATSLPPGLAFAAPASITGTPTQTGTFSSQIDGDVTSICGIVGCVVPAVGQIALTVQTALAPPIVVTQPLGTAALAGSKMNFGVGAVASGNVTYQWQSKPAGAAGFSNIAGANSPLYTTPVLALGDSGTQFQCVVSNAAGSVTSSPALLLVFTSATAPLVTAQPQNASVLAGQPATFSCAVSNAILLQWMVQLPGGSGFANILGATSSQYTVPSTSLLDNGKAFACQASNNFGQVISNFALLTVSSPGAAAPVINSPVTASATAQTPFTYEVSASNNPTSFTAAGLPTGLSINSSTGLISGTPVDYGPSNVALTATNATGTGTSFFALTVNPAAVPPIITSPPAAAGTVGTAFMYVITTAASPVISYGTTSTLPPGLLLHTALGYIYGTPTHAGTYTVNLTALGDYGTGTGTVVITISSAGAQAPVILSQSSASGTVGVPLSYTIVASHTPTSYGATGLPAGLSVDGATGIISGTPTAAGTSNASISATNAVGTGTASLAFSIASAPPAPVITSAASATGTVGTAFSFQVTANNNPAVFGETGLPPGLLLDASTGLITGTPTLAGTFSVALSANNTSGTGTATLALTINPVVAPAPVITSALTSAGTVGTAFNYQIAASNAPTSFGATGLPAGLGVNAATGLISGTLSAAGTFAVGLSATNAGGTGTATLSLTVTAAAPAAPVIDSASTASGQAGVAFGYQIAASNSPSSFAATGLPVGLTVSIATGLISGTPLNAGVSNVTLLATNSGGTGTASLIITVAPAAAVDAGTGPATDAGTTPSGSPDAGTGADAGAGTTPGPDAGSGNGGGTAPAPSLVGSGCAASGSDSGSSGLVLLALAALLAVPGARRRRE